MNIIKIQDQLKGAPDQALIGYVQNPTGQVPTYLALSELERRKSMREKYQQGQPEKKTIAESIIEGAQPQAPQQPQMPSQQMPQGGVASLPEAQPMMQAMQPPPQMPPQGMAQGGMVAFEDGGLAELDVGNMFNEANYASGGIVAFDDGGEVRHYAQGDYVLPADYDPEAMMMQYAEAESNIPRYTSGDQFGENYKKKLEELRKMSRSPYDTAIEYYESIPKPMIGPGTVYSRPENVLKREREQWFKSKPAMTPTIGVTDDKNKGDKNKTDNKVAENKGKPPFVGNTGADYGFETVKGIGDYAKELQDYIGADPAKAGLQERLSKMDAAAAKQAEQAPWLALAKAGFEMANQRAEFGKAAETPLASAARGAGAGLKDYIEAKDKLTSLEEKRFGIANDLARSDRAERIAIAKFGADSKQAVEAANRHAKLQEQHDKVLIQMNNADNATRVATAGAKNILEPEKIIAAKEKIRSGNPTYLSWYNDMTKKNKNIVNTPQFKREEEALVNELVMREGSLNPTPTIDTSQWSLGQPQR
jgi:hypothetical protein